MAILIIVLLLLFHPFLPMLRVLPYFVAYGGTPDRLLLELRIRQKKLSDAYKELDNSRRTQESLEALDALSKEARRARKKSRFVLRTVKMRRHQLDLLIGTAFIAGRGKYIQKSIN